jgi:hypothetical protein
MDLLREYARLCYEPYRRTVEPTAPWPNPRLVWRETDGEWHVWAGSFDLYADIKRRRESIVADAALSDVTA